MFKLVERRLIVLVLVFFIIFFCNVFLKNWVGDGIVVVLLEFLCLCVFFNMLSFMFGNLVCLISLKVFLGFEFLEVWCKRFGIFKIFVFVGFGGFKFLGGCEMLYLFCIFVFRVFCIIFVYKWLFVFVNIFMFIEIF